MPVAKLGTIQICQVIDWVQHRTRQRKLANDRLQSREGSARPAGTSRHTGSGQQFRLGRTGGISPGPLAISLISRVAAAPGFACCRGDASWPSRRRPFCLVSGSGLFALILGICRPWDWFGLVWVVVCVSGKRRQLREATSAARRSVRSTVATVIVVSLRP